MSAERRSDIELFTARTPNGWKASITLEELGLDYNVRPLSLSDNQQKEPWYLAINPNGRIPAIIDHSVDPGFAVFESGAILIYLAEKAGALLPTDVRGRSQVIQWLMFQMGGVGPMMGQANVFANTAPEKMPWAIERYRGESRRLLTVLNDRLADRQFLVDDFSIADIANWSWVHGHAFAGIDVEGLDHLKRWIDDVGARPAVKRGKLIPTPLDLNSPGAVPVTNDTGKMLA